MTMSTSVLSLPIPLLLLVHLHILQYPHANKSEYDHNIFEPSVRGLRERTKLLEDICYFLVGRLEGNPRSVLPTYPCVVPSDTVAFRTSLARYLENLRHGSVYPKSLASVNRKNKGSEANLGSGLAAWWWKDVLVRKSLLEECVGDRFERLLLSVSTHVLFKTVSLPMVENGHALLHSQPVLYANLLAKCKSARHSWANSASLLLSRQQDLRSLHERLKVNGGVLTSRYSSLSTQRLVALADSKRQGLLSSSWSGENGRLALKFLLKLSGLEGESAPAPPLPNPTRVPSATESLRHSFISIQPLPVAAAHHPANLKKIRQPLFPSSKPKPPFDPQGATNTIDPESNVAHRELSKHITKVALADILDAETRMHQALADARAKMQTIGEGLVARMKALEAKVKIRRNEGVVVALDLWQPGYDGQSHVIYFDTQPTPDLLRSLSLEIPSAEGLDSRIDNIRKSLRPAYPPIPELSTPQVEPMPDTVPLQRVSNTDPMAVRSNLPLRATGTSKSTKVVSASAPIPPSLSSGLHPPEMEVQTVLLTSTPPQSSDSAKLRALSAHSRKQVQVGEHEGPKSSKKVPRKSLRFSLATTRRPSLFAGSVSSDEEDILESSVDRIVSGTEDTSMEGVEGVVPATPKTRAGFVNRIFTAGTPRGTGGPGLTVTKGRKQSYPMRFQEPTVALPSLVAISSDGLFDDDDDDGWPGEWGGQAVDVGFVEERDEDGYGDEEPSMTLRDILLSADVSQFDLLEDEGDDLDDDASFDWE